MERLDPAKKDRTARSPLPGIDTQIFAHQNPKQIEISSTMFPKEKQLLPSTFTPSESTVLIGKGRTPREAPGNKKLQALVSAQVYVYSQCQERKVRAGIIKGIMGEIAKTCSDDDAPFAKFYGGRWWRVDETTIRENISATFRNKLSDKYKSSTKHKSAKRRNLKAIKRAAWQSLLQE